MVDRQTLEGTIVNLSTNGNEFEAVSQDLKRKYIHKYRNIYIEIETEKTHSHAVQSIERKEIVVNLLLLSDKRLFGRTIDNDEIEWFRKTKIASASSSFVYKDIIQTNNDYVIISGIPGCGKTTLVETILYKWSMDELWKDHFDFVFIIYFRQLVRFKSDESITCDKILSYFYPGVDFSRLPQTNKTLLIMDGFDEFADKEDFKNSPEEFSPFVQAVYDMVHPNNPSFPFTRLLTSRPGRCHILFDTLFNESFEQNLRIFQIIGFDQKNMCQYIHQHIQDTQLAENLLLKISKSPILQNFITIPFFCWGIGYLIKRKEITVEHIPVTATAIYANLLTLFIRNHGLQKPTMRMKDLFHDEGFQKMILTLSEMAFQLQTKKKLVFNKTDLEKMDDIDVLMKSGLLMKVECESEDCYQFLHYSFQEFLSSLHLYYIASIRIHSINIISGLCGGKVANSTSDEIVQKFSHMKKTQLDVDELKSFLKIHSDSLNFRHFVKLVFEFQSPLHLEYFTINYKFFYPSTTLLNYIEKQAKDGRFSIKNLVLRVHEKSPLPGRKYTALYPLMISSKTIIIYDDIFHIVNVLKQIEEQLSYQRLEALDIRRNNADVDERMNNANIGVKSNNTKVDLRSSFSVEDVRKRYSDVDVSRWSLRRFHKELEYLYKERDRLKLKLWKEREMLKVDRNTTDTHYVPSFSNTYLTPMERMVCSFQKIRIPLNMAQFKNLSHDIHSFNRENRQQTCFELRFHVDEFDTEIFRTYGHRFKDFKVALYWSYGENFDKYYEKTFEVATEITSELQRWNRIYHRFNARKVKIGYVERVSSFNTSFTWLTKI